LPKKSKASTAKCLDCGILKTAYLARTQSHAHVHHMHQI